MCRRKRHLHGKRLGNGSKSIVFCVAHCRTEVLQVPAISSPTSSPSIYVVSANMKRIDLISKLTAPAFISVLQTWTGSTAIVAVILALQNLASIVPEWLAIQKVWNSCPDLHKDRPMGREIRHGFLLDPYQLVEDFRSYFGTDVWIRR